MSNELIVHKGRTNIVSVDVGYDISTDVCTSQIRSTPAQDAPLIVEWDVSFTTDGTDGKLTLVIDELASSQIKSTSGFMDIKRVSGSESFPLWDKPLEVTFQGTVTA